MRFPVFARRADPSKDSPILRKSLKYVSEQVESGLAVWVDPLDPAKGIQCREMLYFGEREIPVATANLHDLSDRILGLKFLGPKNPLPHFQSNLGPACPWDWTQESISA